MKVLAVAVCAALMLGACGDDDDSGGGDATKAADVLNEALALHVDGKLDAAIEEYRKVIDLDPNNKLAYYNLGLIDQQAGRNASAETQYRQTLALDPDYVPALFNLAILRTEPAPTEAIDLYRHIIAVKPDDANTHLNLGFLLKKLGRDTEGDDEISTAIALDPSLTGRAPTTTSTVADTRTTTTAG